MAGMLRVSPVPIEGERRNLLRCPRVTSRRVPRPEETGSAACEVFVSALVHALLTPLSSVGPKRFVCACCTVRDKARCRVACGATPLRSSFSSRAIHLGFFNRHRHCTTGCQTAATSRSASQEGENLPCRSLPTSHD